MIAYAKNVLNLPKFEYFQLSESVRPTARQAVLNEQIKAVNRLLKDTRTVAKQNINTLVNDRHHIAKILRHKKHIQNLTNEMKRLEGNIDDNYCQFLEDGTYVLYSTHATS